MIKSLRTIAIVCMMVSALFLGLLALDNVDEVSGATLYVGGTGGGNFTTIQDAINASSDGGTVFVYNGTYYENVIVNKTINLIGLDMSNTTIDGSGIGDVVNVTSSWVNITGFTVTNCGTNAGDSAVEFYLVTDCDISYSNLSSINGSGVFLDNSDQMSIHDNIIWNNLKGIHVFSGTDSTIGDNMIIGNQNGIYIEGSFGNTVFHNNFIGNSVHAFDDGTNLWNLLVPTGGNFWDNWTFPDADCDGFVDDPYVIFGGANSDNLPFTEISGWGSSWFNKSAFANYAPSQMPDFDQREKSQRLVQNYWMTINAGPNGILDSAPALDDIVIDPAPGAYNISIAPGPNHLIDSALLVDDTVEFSYCGPAAAANALWWMDSRFADPAGTPGDGPDIFSLVTDYAPGDDHTPGNVPYLIEDLATRFDTINWGDTNATAMVDGLDQLLLFAGLSSNFSVTNESFPDFPLVATEFENCNGVVLFLGFYDDEGTRVYGHIVTLTGVDQGGMKIAISDPIKNIENPIAIWSSYNDTINVSHDIYDVMMGAPHPSLPPQTWWLNPYTSGYNFPMPLIYWAVVENVVYISPLSATVPTEPLGLSESSGNSYVNLTWSAPVDDGGSAIIGYNVYRDGSFLVFVPGQLWYNDTTVTNGVTYTYNVTAVNGVGEGPNSADVPATPMTVPSVPQTPGTLSGDGYVNITWAAPSDDGGSPITGYNIYRNGTVGVYATVPAGQLWYNDTPLLNGITYTYNISAVNAVGEGPQTANVFGTPTSSVTIPSAPQNPQANSGDSYVNLSWTAPLADGGSAITGYNIYRNGTVGVYATVPAGQLWYLDTNVTNGITFTYNVTALNAIGEGPDSGDVAGTPMTVPLAVENLGEDAGSDYVNLTWDVPLDDGGSLITNYYVYRNGTVGVYAIIPATETWFNESGLLDGITYTYNVSAVNLAGEGPNSTILATPGITTAPSEPQNLQVNTGGGYVNLTWEAPLSDGGSPVTSYYIYRNDTPAIHVVINGSQLWYNDTFITNGSFYTYNVSARNVFAVGPNATISSVNPLGVPTIPQNLEADEGFESINLTWDAPADDGARNITGYNIYRNGTLVDTVPADQLWYEETNLTNNTFYTYDIRAVNVEGESIPATIVTTPLSLPTEPLNLQAVAGSGYVQLTWDAPSNNGSLDITSYYIYRSNSTGIYAIVIENELTYNDTIVQNGINYTYHITAVNPLGEGPNSTNVTARPEGVPLAPDFFKATPGNGFINLTWEEPSDEGRNITEYFIYKNGTVGVYMTIPAGTLWFNDTNVVNGITYNYSISANNSLGESETSDLNDIMAGAVPQPPREPSISAGDSSITISWEVPLDDGGMPITNYKVYKGTVSGEWLVLEPFTTQLTYTDSTVTNGLTYYYVVTAESIVGESQYSEEVSAQPFGLSDVPSEFYANAFDSYVILTWKAPFTSGGFPITDYNLYRGTSAANMNLLTTLQDVFSYNDSQVTNGITYFYTISAVTSMGEGPKTTDINATPEAQVTPENKIPGVSISKPGPDTVWKTSYITALIEGAASDSDGTVEKVEIRVNDGEWLEVNGTTAWTYDLDIEGLPAGEIIIYARSYDGQNYSNLVNVTIEMESPSEVKDKSIVEEPGFWIGLIIIILVILLLFFMIFKKRKPKKDKDEYDIEDDEIEEDEEEEEEEDEEDEEEE